MIVKKILLTAHILLILSGSAILFSQYNNDTIFIGGFILGISIFLKMLTVWLAWVFKSMEGE